MNDDIVTRLRTLACPECGLPSTHNHFDEAADEIERLRKLVGTLARSMMPFALLMTKEEQETVIKAVRDDLPTG